MSKKINKKVIIGMSGGVDSSVAAFILKQKGYEVIAITINVWQNQEGKKSCSATKALNDTKKVCEKLEIPLYLIDFKDEFKNLVIDNFASEYIAGRTPNPCIVCNRYIKFEVLLNKSIELEADYIATGHYAKVEYSEKTNRYYLKKSITDQKDQTYALYNLTQEQLKHILMPLGDYTKEEVRNIAIENNLVNANKKDSQEICFVEDNNYAKFIEEKYKYTSKSGDFVDNKGKVLGKHKGIIHYTIGQRRGLGLSLKTPMYVIGLDVKKNLVILGEEKDLLKNTLTCTDVNFMPFEKLENPIKVKSKIRYNSEAVKSTIYPLENDNVKVVFEEEVKAITPGQAVVFYLDDIVIGEAKLYKACIIIQNFI